MRIMTLNDLYSFFVNKNQSINFDSKESEEPIVVTVPGNFESTGCDSMVGMMKLKLKVCHTNLNNNGSFISDDNMKAAMPSLKYRPILAHIHTLPDGEEDFFAHNIEFVEGDDGVEKIEYIEKQVGCFTADEPILEYDVDSDKTYVIANAVIPEEYTSAADIIRRKNGTKVSCELVINNLEYNAKEKYLEITDFYFGGCTLLGADEDGNLIQEGMAGSRADIADFCHKEPKFVYEEKLIELLDKLNFAIENFNKTDDKKGGDTTMNKFEELLNKYNVTAEDITFEIDGVADEELESKFEEAFGEINEESEVLDNTETDTEKFDDCEDEEVETGDTEKNTKTYSFNEDGSTTISFEISHDDIRNSLYNLLAGIEEQDNVWYYITEVFDSYFVYGEFDSNVCYKQEYVINEDNVSFTGERQELFKMLLTASEKESIENMRNDYSNLELQYNELKEFKDKYDADVLKAQKDDIFSREEYSVLADDESFKELVANAESYSVKECEDKADIIFAKYCKNNGSFAMSGESSHVIGIPVEHKETKDSPYGNLFA